MRMREKDRRLSIQTVTVTDLQLALAFTLVTQYISMSPQANKNHAENVNALQTPDKCTLCRCQWLVLLIP
jgi:hypothetical protein